MSTLGLNDQNRAVGTSNVESSSYIVLSLVSTILCTIGGIVTTVYSIKTIHANSRLDFYEAERTSRLAKGWMIGSLLSGGLALAGKLSS